MSDPFNTSRPQTDTTANIDTTPKTGTSSPSGGEAGLRQASEDLRASSRAAREAASEVASTVAAEAAAAAGTLKKEGAALLDTARSRAEGMAQEGVEAGADRAKGVARAIHRAADELEKENPELARMVHDAGGAIDNMARALRERSPGDMLRGAEDFARRQPLAFFGVAALAGFALTRFARASASHDHGSQYGGQHDMQYGMGGGYRGGMRDTGMRDTGHDMSTAGTGATGTISGGSMTGGSGLSGSGIGGAGTMGGAGTTGTADIGGTGAGYPQTPSTPHDTASGAPGWVQDETGKPRPSTLASASLGGAAAHRPSGQDKG